MKRLAILSCWALLATSAYAQTGISINKTDGTSEILPKGNNNFRIKIDSLKQETTFSTTGGVITITDKEYFTNQPDIYVHGATSVSLGNVTTHLATSQVVLENGICYSNTNSTPSVNDNSISRGLTSLYNIKLENLEEASTYYVRTWARTKERYLYSDTFTFNTKSPSATIQHILTGIRFARITPEFYVPEDLTNTTEGIEVVPTAESVTHCDDGTYLLTLKEDTEYQVTLLLKSEADTYRSQPSTIRTGKVSYTLEAENMSRESGDGFQDTVITVTDPSMGISGNAYYEVREFGKKTNPYAYFANVPVLADVPYNIYAVVIADTTKTSARYRANLNNSNKGSLTRARTISLDCSQLINKIPVAEAYIPEEGTDEYAGTGETIIPYIYLMNNISSSIANDQELRVDYFIIEQAETETTE